jgi:hypothetical protein
MKVTGQGFKYFLDGVQLKDFDAFEKAIKTIQVEVEVNSENLEIHARKF